MFVVNGDVGSNLVLRNTSLCEGGEMCEVVEVSPTWSQSNEA